MSPIKTFQEFFQQYMLMYRPFESQLNQELGKHGLHRAQWTILYYLVNEGPSTLVELAHYQRVEKPTMTRTVSRLEELGYVDHLPGKDRREKRMQLTAEGTKVYQKVRVTIDKFEQEILEGIPEDTQQLIIESMKAIRMNLINKESTK
ncbi:putative HTH-type transcriptional regulator [Planococcus massiliensis]|uniref:Putative HTH-type transcriptional regulator n=1 Tax=Planococcus massiliensis TaxID=1499687 RepID=A0A098EG45_9BACL|nr:MarR family transcriptional regulator [Planococcus massiliensis]CEG21269.1 putative HTH-type transcriptional regulator [Planococcus massiliensis]